jgi:DMSO reductase family type II enzyme heme b subunit
LALTKEQSVATLLGLSAAAAIVLGLTHTRLSASAVAPLVARVAEPASAADPDSGAWREAGGVRVALASGGIGVVRTATVRALSDGERLYVLLEWPDESPDQSFKGPYATIEQGETLRDAAQLAFGARKVEPLPLFELAGGVGAVALWQWSSHWQRAVETAAAGVVGDRTPEGLADVYPFENDALFYPARAAGNENARESRAGTAELRVASAGVETRLHPAPELSASGTWSNGWWQVLFVRPLATPGDPAPIFMGNRTTFTVSLWDGGLSDRDAGRAISTAIPLYAKVPVAANAVRVVLLGAREVSR